MHGMPWSISICTKTQTTRQQSLARVRLGKTESQTTESKGWSWYQVGTKETRYRRTKEKDSHTPTNRLYRRHHFLWQTVGCLCLSGTTAQEESLVD